MGILVRDKDRLLKAECENRRLKGQLERAEAIIEYVAICDYPEIFEDETFEEEIVDGENE